MPHQVCPNCQTRHDVSIYVSGQRVRCACGIPFEVRRQDVSVLGGRNVLARPAAEPSALSPSPLPKVPELSAVPEAPAGSRTEVDDGSAHTVIKKAEESRIPGYQLLSMLGRGGMGEVWKANQLSLGRTVAVKILPDTLAKDAEFVSRFEKEATALGQLSHPNIIQIIDRGAAGHSYYFAMELVEGRSLRDALESGTLTADEGLKIVAQVLLAIDYAHEKGIIHRDLKPENILLDGRGHAKVADFGLAGMQQGSSGAAPYNLTATSVAMGTVNYMAPEQRRDAKSVDGRADLYSLGVILYELLTGELPIGRFKLPSEKIAGLDPRLDAIVARALEPDREQRYKKAAEIHAELLPLLGSGVSKPPVAASHRSAPVTEVLPADRSRIHSVRVGFTIVGALAAIAVAVNTFFATPEPAAAAAAEAYGPSAAVRNAYPPNTNDQLYASVLERSEAGQVQLSYSFVDGDAEFNGGDGQWTVQGGKLVAVQAGNMTERERLKPRTYLASRYFSADDFRLETDVAYRSLASQYPTEADASHFAEVAFRIVDLQVSVFAIPDVGMRLMWRYFTPDGVEVTGNSARDSDRLLEDEVTPPKEGQTARVRLTLKRVPGGVEVEAFKNNERFARKLLPGLEGQVGKVALGCRNLKCEFQNLVVIGKPEERPQRFRQQARNGP